MYQFFAGNILDGAEEKGLYIQGEREFSLHAKGCLNLKSQAYSNVVHVQNHL